MNTAAQNWDRDRANLWHPYTRFSALEDPFPAVTRGEGPFLYTEDGTRYVDAIASWWACSLGHSHPAIVTAIREQTAELQHCILGNLTHPKAIELAERIARMLPTPDRHVLFASDGASAVEAAMRVCLHYHRNVGRTGRTRFISLKNAYHGDTLATVSVGFLDHFHADLRDVVLPVEQLTPPYASMRAAGIREAQWDPRSLDAARDTFARAGASTAACIVEPLCQGAAGMMMYPPDYLHGLAALCREFEVPLVVDEIATGFGRTGTMFAFEQAGIDPDIVCLGKALTAGALPMSAAAVSDRLYATFDDGERDRTLYHGHTFAGNPIAAAAACAALEIYAADDFLPGVLERAAILCEVFAPLLDQAHIADVRCLGMFAAIEFQELPADLRERLAARRVLARPLGKVLYLAPPLNMETGALRNLAETVRDVARL